MTGADERPWLQHFAQTFGQTGRAKDFPEKKKGTARILILRNREQRALEFRIRSELVSPGIEPGVYGGIGHAQFGLQFPRIPLRVVYEKSRVDAEEAWQ